MENVGKWLLLDYPQVESTNDCAVELSSAPPAAYYAVTAVTQTKGRGRRGRSWSSLEGNLFMSLALPLPMEKWGELIFVVALCLLQTIRKFSPGADVKIKWPNDVLLNGGKISGILLEKGAGKYIIAGIGVNIAVAPGNSSDLVYPVTSLRDAEISTDRCAFLKAYLLEFDGLFAQWRDQGFEPVRRRWLENVRGLDEKIAVNTARDRLEGIFCGVDEQGFLLLQQGEKLIKVYAGDVFYI